MPRSQDGPTPVGDERFDALVDLLVGTGEFHAGKMFGARGLKRTSGKFFVAQIDDDLIFKLPPSEHAEALALEGAVVFEPMEARPMKQWVQVPPAHARFDESLARAAATTIA